jgi:hypothetical protein
VQCLLLPAAVSTAQVTHERSLSSEKYVLCCATTVCVCVCVELSVCGYPAMSVCHANCVDPMRQLTTPFVSAVKLSAAVNAVFVYYLPIDAEECVGRCKRSSSLDGLVSGPSLPRCHCVDTAVCPACTWQMQHSSPCTLQHSRECLVCTSHALHPFPWLSSVCCLSVHGLLGCLIGH